MSDTVAIVALIVAVLAIPVTIWATRRWGNRRAVLSYTVEVAPVLPEAEHARGLVVTYRDIPVPDPHLVTLTFVNSGPKDITSDLFDGGKPMTVQLTGTFYGMTASVGDPVVGMPAVGTESGVLAFRPKLIKRGETWAVSLIVGGAVEIMVDAPLADTDLKSVAAGNAEYQHAMMMAMLELLPGSRGLKALRQLTEQKRR